MKINKIAPYFLALAPFAASCGGVRVSGPDGTGGKASPPNHRTILGYGDSITSGTDSSAGSYTVFLEQMLKSHGYDVSVINGGQDGIDSVQGCQRIGGALDQYDPDDVVIVLGTNDWYQQPDTTANLFCIVDAVNKSGRRAYLATIIPANTDYRDENGNQDWRVPQSRNEWVHQIDDRIRAEAPGWKAGVIDLEAAFLRYPGRIGELFDEHVHPNMAGTQMIADECDKAIEGK